VWVIDSQAESVTDHASLLAPRVIGSEELLEGGEVVPGFRARVGEIFEI
jgi:hypothetical protein